MFYIIWLLYRSIESYYHIIPHKIILSHIILHYIILYYIILHYTILFNPNLSGTGQGVFGFNVKWYWSVYRSTLKPETPYLTLFLMKKDMYAIVFMIIFFIWISFFILLYYCDTDLLFLSSFVVCKLAYFMLLFNIWILPVTIVESLRKLIICF